MNSRPRFTTVCSPSKATHGSFLAIALTFGFALLSGLIAANLSAQCPTITLTPSVLLNATQNSPYSQQLAAAGGTASYNFVFDPASLPPGWLTLSSTGTLAGMPPASGSFTFGVKVLDSAGCSGVHVTAYGSVIDQVTGDPTYVPAQ